MRQTIILSFLLVVMLNQNTSIAQCPTTPTIALTSQAQVDAFCTITNPGCTMLPGSLIINDSNDGVNDITNLNALSCLMSIDLVLTPQLTEVLTPLMLEADPPVLFS